MAVCRRGRDATRKSGISAVYHATTRRGSRQIEAPERCTEPLWGWAATCKFPLLMVVDYLSRRLVEMGPRELAFPVQTSGRHCRTQMKL